MSSRAGTLLVLAVIAAGCADEELRYIQVRARATEAIQLEPAGALTFVADATFRWELVSAPPASRGPEPVPHREDFTARLVPDVRGDYVVERWIIYGLGEELTHAFFVETTGAPPQANATVASGSIALQELVTIDGSTSTSVENLPLTHQWRLIQRPEGSAATLTSSGPMATLVADVVGGYVVELAVFDGELWSQVPSTVVLNAQ